MRKLSPVVELLRQLRRSPTTAPVAEEARFTPPEIPESPSDAENLAGWGYADTQFEVKPSGNVQLTGSRYTICGAEMPHLLSWMGDTMASPLSATDTLPSTWPNNIPAAVENVAFSKAITEFLKPTQWSTDAGLRQRHGHGHTQEEIYAVNYGSLERVPDLIVYPTTTEEVQKLVEAAAAHGAILIPFGGGTNVTDALRCPKDEARTIVSVDMRRMRHVLWIDPVNRTACIGAGMTGRHIMEQLATYGFTMGHEPDSVEFSTLGGWIATNASGMKKNKYGNIEDLVLDVEVVTARGLMTRSNVGPRESVGVDPRRMMFGSEGCLGIITSAVVRIFPLPAISRFDSFLFKNFSDGFQFMRDLTASGQIPASLRLMDNTQFHFGQALKPHSEGLDAFKSRLEAKVVKLRGYDVEDLVVATLVFEGEPAEVAIQQQTATRIAKQHGGMSAGSGNGEKGYQLTFGIAYIRDLIFKHHMIAESFETSVPWGQAEHLFERVKARAREEHAAMGLPGKPFVTGRVTQVYTTGVCCYFYLGFYAKGMEDPVGTYLQLEQAVREEILDCGGSLSHHHGVGKIRQHFLPEIHSPAALSVLRATKDAVDPDGVFGAGNQAFGAAQ